MAVAAHVSRVAKEYAPHGYSIMERVTLMAEESLTGGARDITIPLLYSDDGGLWVEAIRVIWPMGYGSNWGPGGGAADPDVDNQWHIDVVGSTFGGGVAPVEVSNILHLETFGAGDPGPGTNYPVVAPGAAGGPPFNGHLIPSGSFLGIRVQELDTGAGPGSGLMVMFNIRYRAKA